MLEAVEDPGPHRGQKALPDGTYLVDLPPRGDGPDYVDAEEQQHYSGEPRHVARQDVAVYGAADQPRPAGLRRRPEHYEPEHEEELAGIGTQLPEQPPGGRHPCPRRAPAARWLWTQCP